jgi:hypothetical protein
MVLFYFLQNTLFHFILISLYKLYTLMRLSVIFHYTNKSAFLDPPALPFTFQTYSGHFLHSSTHFLGKEHMLLVFLYLAYFM